MASPCSMLVIPPVSLKTPPVVLLVLAIFSGGVLSADIGQRRDRVPSIDVNERAGDHHLELCPESWIFLNGRCYYIPSTPQTVHFDKAKEECTKLGAILAEPKDKQTTVALTLQLRGTGDLIGYWLGMHDMADEARFVYDSNGRYVQYAAWGPGEPNDHGAGEDCVHLNVHKIDVPLNNWNDLPCNHGSQSYICEKEPTWVNGGIPIKPVDALGNGNEQLGNGNEQLGNGNGIVFNIFRQH